jgi:hypothetical protein
VSKRKKVQPPEGIRQRMARLITEAIDAAADQQSRAGHSDSSWYCQDTDHREQTLRNEVNKLISKLLRSRRRFSTV